MVGEDCRVRVGVRTGGLWLVCGLQGYGWCEGRRVMVSVQTAGLGFV